VAHAVRGAARQAASGSFLKKRTKNLLILKRISTPRCALGAKVFWFFFSKKTCFFSATA
jgi:hypothetical protein